MKIKWGKLIGAVCLYLLLPATGLAQGDQLQTAGQGTEKTEPDRQDEEPEKDTEPENSSQLESNDVFFETVDLFLLCKTSPEISGKSLQRTIENTIRSEEGGNYRLASNKVSVEPKSLGEYELLKKFIDQPESFIDADFSPDLQLYGSNVWKVYVDDPGSQFKAIDIRYRIGDTQHEETFSRDDKTGRFREENDEMGIYRLEIAPNWVDKEYRLVYERSGESTEFKKWPKREKYFLIRIIGFKGGLKGRQKLFEILSDKKRANPLVFSGGGEPSLFSGMNIGDIIFAGPLGVWDKSTYTLTMPNIATQQKVNRLWVCFPLTKSELDKIQNKLQDGYDGDQVDYQDIIDEIKGEANVLNLETGISRASDSISDLTPNDDRKVWYEIRPNERGELSRSFHVRDPIAWANLLDENRQFYSLTIYEGEDFGKPVAIMMRNIDNSKKPWIEQPLENWVGGINDLIGGSENE